MIHYTPVLFTLRMTVTVFSCNNSKLPNEPNQIQSYPTPLVEDITTQEEQKALTPDTVIQRLKAGNKRFVENNVTARDHSKMVRATASGQYPKSVVLSCLDSRIPVEDVFDKGIGDMFVARNAGNIVNEDLLGSMEFACKVSGAKLILVMGHSGCGAVKAVIDDVKMGNITAMLAKIKPAVALSENFRGEKNSKNGSYTDEVGKNNVLHTIETIKLQSPILKEMLDKGEIKMVGAFYDINSGVVTFL